MSRSRIEAFTLAIEQVGCDSCVKPGVAYALPGGQNDRYGIVSGRSLRARTRARSRSLTSRPGYWDTRPR